MNKQIILQSIIDQLQDELERISQAVQDAHAVSTDQANIPENKYDTLALEASYLEQGQSQRMIEAEDALKAYSTLRLRILKESDVVQLSALLSLESDTKEEQLYFFGPCAGGLAITYRKKNITMITPGSPIGKAVLGKKVGETVEICVAGNTKTQTIKQIW